MLRAFVAAILTAILPAGCVGALFGITVEPQSRWDCGLFEAYTPECVTGIAAANARAALPGWEETVASVAFFVALLILVSAAMKAARRDPKNLAFVAAIARVLICGPWLCAATFLAIFPMMAIWFEAPWLNLAIFAMITLVLFRAPTAIAAWLPRR